MKILVVSQYFYPENFRVNDLCQGLVDKGHDVTVYTGLPNYPAGSFFSGYSWTGPYDETLGNIKIIRTPLIPRGKNKSWLLALNYFSFFFIATLLAPFRVRGSYDKIFVFATSPITSAIPAIFLRFLKRAPVFLWVLDLWPESLKATGVIHNQRILDIVGLMVKGIYKFTDKILVASKGAIQRTELLGGKPSQIVFFPQWSEEFFLEEVKSPMQDPLIQDESFKVMFAGNIGTSQDFETLVKAAEILKDHKDIHFLILGSGLMERWAKDEVKRLSLEETFIFLGSKPVEMMPGYYSKADLLLLSLKNTDLFSITIPGKLQSYLASRKAIIGSVNGEAAEVIHAANCGIAVPASSPHLLAEAILSLKTCSEKDLEEMGRNGQNYYRMHYSRKILLDQLEHLMSITSYT
ncbi:MAG: glycosyltransferase family 4 protein [Bacteriovoracaceae bacterium]